MKVIKAKFIGTNSLGYEHGKYYTLVLYKADFLRRLLYGWDLEIRRVDDSRGYCPYKNIDTFLANWDEITVV